MTEWTISSDFVRRLAKVGFTPEQLQDALNELVAKGLVVRVGDRYFTPENRGSTH